MKDFDDVSTWSFSCRIHIQKIFTGPRRHFVVHIRDYKKTRQNLGPGLTLSGSLGGLRDDS